MSATVDARAERKCFSCGKPSGTWKYHSVRCHRSAYQGDEDSFKIYLGKVFTKAMKRLIRIDALREEIQGLQEGIDI